MFAKRSSKSVLLLSGRLTHKSMFTFYEGQEDNAYSHLRVCATCNVILLS